MHAAILPSNLVSGDTSSEATLKTVQGWIKECTSEHSKCNEKLKEQTALPPRVIDIGLIDDEGTVKLVETAENEKGTYICLSHCWGTAVIPIRTTLSNITSHKEGILLSALPRTFQDALNFVRRLGLRYIWIDSLCIVQDDNDDWLLHAKSMANIYQYAHLTLAATWAEDGTVGCYSSTSTYDATLLSAENIDPSPIYYRRMLPHWWDRTTRIASYSHNSSDYPLLSRAWVFQERILSPRILHFGKGELLWECMENYTCECTSSIRTFTNHPKAEHAALLHNSSNAEISKGWRQLVAWYSKLSITYASDRLPALMGIAEPMLAASPSRIIGGCWEPFLIYDILWSSSGWASESGKTDSKSTAPTWSWMSTPYMLRYEFQNNANVLLQATLEDIQIDQTKGIDDGFKWWALLSLSVRMIPVKLGENLSHSSSRWITPDVLSEGRHLRWFTEPDYRYWEEGPRYLKEDDRLFCVWMARFSEHVDFGLVIRCVDEKESLYERVGSVSHDLHYKLGETIEAYGKMTRITLV